MKIERLFNVLVLGGAALGGACSDGGSGEGAQSTSPSMSGTSDDTDSGDPTEGIPPESGGGSGGSADDGDVAPGETNTSAAGSGGTTVRPTAVEAPDAGDGGVDGGSSAIGTLECSVSPNPVDPCGCPCCWYHDCLNDEECCGGFCSSGDNGNGCCPE